jgi:hypothetical protein
VAGRISKDALRFLRAAGQRYLEARFLLEKGEFTTAAVYLAGYGVECILKALILRAEPAKENARTLRTFRGEKAHRFDWLNEQVRRRRVSISAETLRDLTTVNWWTTTLRYDPVVIKRRDAVQFLNSTEVIIRWARGRI